MTENLLQKLEEKLVSLLGELEELHNEIKRLKQENVLLKTEKSKSLEKIESLVALVDAVDLTDTFSHHQEKESHVEVEDDLSTVQSRFPSLNLT